MKPFRKFSQVLLCLSTLANAQEPTPPTAAPSAPPAPEGETKPLTAEDIKKSIRKISDHEFQLGEINLNTETKTLRFPATMKIVRGPLEYLVVHEMGSAHESLFMTKVTPFEIHIGMLLIGCKPSETFFKKVSPESFPEVVQDAVISPESSFDVVVEWKDEAGNMQSAPAESWVKNLETESTVAVGSWVYNGSFLNEKGDLAAQGAGNIIAFFIDPVALANNPRKGNELDDIWESKPLLKKEGEPVTLAFKIRPAVKNTSKDSSTGASNKKATAPATSADKTKSKP